MPEEAPPPLYPPGPEVSAEVALRWLRRLLEDQPVTESELATADGKQLVFAVSNPPMITGTITVGVDGTVLTEETDYTVDPSSSKIVFPIGKAPAEDASVEIQYNRQTWGDEELELYLEQANTEWYAQRHVVYQAFIYAAESVMFGTATGLSFGSGDEKFDIPSVFTRLTQRVDKVRAWLEAQKDEPYLTVFDLVFDVEDPGYPDDWERLGNFNNPDLMPPVI
jgi:hypothetical protein